MIILSFISESEIKLKRATLTTFLYCAILSWTHIYRQGNIFKRYITNQNWHILELYSGPTNIQVGG